MTSPDLVIYRALYRNLLIAALDAEIVATAADFAAMVAADAGASTMVSARAGDIKAVCAVCDAAEARVDAWLDARELPSPPPPPPRPVASPESARADRRGCRAPIQR